MGNGIHFLRGMAVSKLSWFTYVVIKEALDV